MRDVQKTDSPFTTSQANRERIEGELHATCGLKGFSRKGVVPSYARWFGVDLICGAKELQILGMEFSSAHLEALRRTAAGRPRHCRDAAKKAKTVEVESTWKDDFAYVAGYTEAGFPFGVTWEEIEGLDGGDVGRRGDELRKSDCEGSRVKRDC